MRGTVLLLLLCACSKPPDAPVGVSNATEATPPESSASASAPAPTPAPSDKPGTPARPGMAEGQTCGGIAGLRCAEGLTCKMSGPVHPDQAGVCAKP